jgi:hypothetical protein
MLLDALMPLHPAPSTTKAAKAAACGIFPFNFTENQL